jgi:hypothetical protein
MNRKPKKPKSTLLKKTSGAAEVMQVGPIVTDIVSYAIPAVGALGVGALAHVRRKLKKIDKEFGGAK